MGARVIVTEIDPTRALEAVMDGYMVLPIAEAATRGDFFVTVAGNKHVIRGEHFAAMRDGAVVANAGHFDVELDLGALYELAVERRQLRPSLEEMRMRDGRRIYLLAEGRLVNLAAAEGHPADVMDMSFANQALSAEFLAREAGDLAVDVYPVPEAIDTNVARLKLESMGVSIDSLTSSQTDYMHGWRAGT
jgi:adenosylhomocysteinase